MHWEARLLNPHHGWAHCEAIGVDATKKGKDMKESGKRFILTGLGAGHCHGLTVSPDGAMHCFSGEALDGYTQASYGVENFIELAEAGLVVYDRSYSYKSQSRLGEDYVNHGYRLTQLGRCEELRWRNTPISIGESRGGNWIKSTEGFSFVVPSQWQANRNLTKGEPFSLAVLGPWVSEGPAAAGTEEQ